MSIYLNQKEIEDLPNELLRELSLMSDREREILEVLNSYGPISLDILLIELYKRSGNVIPRGPLTCVLHRMKLKGLIERPQRGCYSAVDSGF